MRIKIRVATFDTNYSVTDSTQTIAALVQRLPDSVVKSAEIATDGFDVSGEMIKISISLRLTVYF